MFEALLKGLTLGLLLSISVGPVIFSIIKQSLNNGHRGGIAFILGVSMVASVRKTKRDENIDQGRGGDPPATNQKDFIKKTG